MEIIDDAIFDLLRQIEGQLRTDSRFFVNDAAAIAAIAMFLYFGIKAFGLISGDQKWEIMPLLRPFGLTMVIIFWLPFVDLLEFPFEIFEARTEALYEDQTMEINSLLAEKSKLKTEYALQLTEISQDVESVDGSDSDGFMGTLGIDIDSLVNEAKSLYLVVLSKFEYVLEQIIHWVILALFQMCVYLIFFLQMFFKYILIVLGPLAFALSIIPAFRDSYTTWIGRFISVALYSTIARIVLFASFKFVRYSLMSEIQVYKDAMKDPDAFIVFATGSDGSQISFIVALLTGGAAMLTIPVISTWIVNTSGVGQAIGKMSKGMLTGVKAGL
jgi:hypothetical protein